ncbi:MAG: glycosyltransferase [Helicobacteraceae bacterium]|nr:glycosyltransferase [Helicobacteraceae bacterium]
MNITVVIPTYKVRSHIENVVKSLPSFINNIIVVDDKCPQNSGVFVEELNLKKVTVIFHQENQGVGGAIVTGYKKALELNSDIVVKVDGDGQMNPEHIEQLVKPIVENRADYTKGNRFSDFTALKQMPKVRLFGNSALSFLVKASSGYWDIMDPTNGFTAITKEAILGLELDKLSKRYFFESDMLINLNIENSVVKDVALPAKYEEEESSLSVTKVLFEFPPKLFKGFLRRIFYKYYIYNFNMASIYMLLGFPMFIFGFIYGSVSWYTSVVTGVTASTGSVMLSALPIILGVQFLLQAISIDINNLPRK